jgi:hypothetical protein
MHSTREQKIAAFKEATSDTVLATVLNFPLNLLLVSLARAMELTILETSIFFTIVFSIVAILRKTWVRLYFFKKDLKKWTKNA